MSESLNKLAEDRKRAFQEWLLMRGRDAFQAAEIARLVDTAPVGIARNASVFDVDCVAIVEHFTSRCLGTEFYGPMMVYEWFVRTRIFIGCESLGYRQW